MDGQGWYRGGSEPVGRCRAVIKAAGVAHSPTSGAGGAPACVALLRWCACCLQRNFETVGCENSDV